MDVCDDPLLHLRWVDFTTDDLCSCFLSQAAREGGARQTHDVLAPSPSLPDVGGPLTGFLQTRLQS